MQVVPPRTSPPATASSLVLSIGSLLTSGRSALATTPSTPGTTCEPAAWLSKAEVRVDWSSGVAAGRQVPLIPRDGKLAVAARATQADGVTCEGRAGATHGAHRVSGAPGGRHTVGVAGTRHDGPAKRPVEHRFEPAARHRHGLGGQLEHGVVAGDLDDSVPRAASETTVEIHAQPGPGDGLFSEG